MLQRAKADLNRYYPTVDGKPTVAYLWARTVTCKNCRATVPLLKTRWLCKKDNKRVVLTMEPNADRTGVVFGVQHDAPSLAKGSSAQKREHDKQLAGGTMSRSGVTCPCCSTIMTMEDLRSESLAGRTGTVLTAVVADGDTGKEYRRPIEEEIIMATEAEKELAQVYADIPFGLPIEPLPRKEALGFRVPLYGFDKWYKLFTPRQLLAIGTFVKYTRAVREVLRKYEYSDEWVEAVSGYLALGLDRLADYSSSVCSWHNSGEKLRNTFGRFALPIVWDFTEVATCSETSGGYFGAIEWIARFISHALDLVSKPPIPSVIQKSATQNLHNTFDVILTDPPYYDAIPYAVM